MKVNMTVDLTPEEARKLFGMPDLEPLQEEMMALMREKMLETITEMSDPDVFLKKAFPMGIQSMESFQKTFADFMSKSTNTD